MNSFETLKSTLALAGDSFNTLKKANGVLSIILKDKNLMKKIEGFGVGAATKIYARLFRMQQGNIGEVKRVKAGFLEARIDSGPGYRIYFSRKGNSLLIGAIGTKDTQQKDIEHARLLI